MLENLMKIVIAFGVAFVLVLLALFFGVVLYTIVLIAKGLVILLILSVLFIILYKRK